MRAIGRLEGTQNQMLEEMRAGFRRINGTLDEHDKKINKLENDNAYRKGISAAISLVVSSAVSFFSFIFRDK
jgi:hypothetical protein